MNAPSEIESMLKAQSFCVIGASRDPGKYGYSVFRAIKSEGKKTYPVNPNAATIGAAVCYPSIHALPETVEVAVFVVPPDVVAKTVPECIAAGIKHIWMQPGAESPEAIEFCEANGIPVVAGPCIMTLLRSDIDEDML